MPHPGPNKIKHLQLGQCKIVLAALSDLKQLIHSYIGETEKNLILCDSNTLEHCLSLIKDKEHPINESHVITLDPGEREKNIGSLHYIWSSLQYSGADKRNTLINIGGGMITDIGGMAASTYKRGISFINVPTSLMGMADAAIGGKTAANLGAVKNQVGTFALPETVMIYPGFLKTLPKEELLAGFAEIVKMAYGFDEKLWAEIKNIPESGHHPKKLIEMLDEGLLWKAVEIKVAVVEQDLHDSHIRQGLNFGHSIGHGLEALYQSNGHVLPHGFAVATGMLCEGHLATNLAGLHYRKYQELEDYITTNFPVIKLEKSDINQLIILIRHDKKNHHGDIRMSLPEAPGTIKTGIICPEEKIRESLAHYIEITQ